MAISLSLDPPASDDYSRAVERAAAFPRLRYMGSKYKVVPALVDIISLIPGRRVLDGFSGSGVVGYTLKAMGREVTTNDFLAVAATIARATVVNSTARLTPADVDRLLSQARDQRRFIQATFAGLYFPHEDHAFLDSAWSHVDLMRGGKRAIAIASLCLAAARKQSRGVFTVTDLRYDDGRRQMHTPLRDLFVEAVGEYNAAVFDSGLRHRAICRDVFDLSPAGYDVVYLDPPYAPPRDDNCYIKRYHFLEGLAVYWRRQHILMETKSKKLEKRFTPFSYKSTIRDALGRLFWQFRRSTIVLSYSSNSVPEADEVVDMLKRVKRHVDVYSIPHRYSFGTHASAMRRQADEYIFVAQ